MDGLSFARAIGTPLNTHLIVHWGGTLAGDDSDGRLFAKLRYLFDKRLRRKFGFELTGVWVRERHRNKRTRHQSVLAFPLRPKMYSRPHGDNFRLFEGSWWSTFDQRPVRLRRSTSARET